MIRFQTNLNGIDPKNLEGFFVGWKSPLSKEKHHETLKNSAYIVLAVDDTTNQVVGFINALSDYVTYAFIPLLEVLPDYQSQGIGSELVKRMFNLLDNLTNIDLICDKDMQPFYKRFDMIPCHAMVIRKYLES